MILTMFFSHNSIQEYFSIFMIHLYYDLTISSEFNWFTFPSQRKAMPKNAQATTQLPSTMDVSGFGTLQYTD